MFKHMTEILLENSSQRNTNRVPLWKQPAVSECGTYHAIGGVPCYEKRFHVVLKFHEPGYAPVQDNTGSYHIDTTGTPLYAQRFLKTFGFYEGYAAVQSGAGGFHIMPNGDPAYKDRYAWCGNFQEGLCPVRNQDGEYFHIDGHGKRLYDQTYQYVGDFKDGVAVVCRDDGKSSHIDPCGRLIHAEWYVQLDVFHKGFARAKDDRGWFHIRKNGIEAYPKRFISIEPFYNGQAHAEDFGGNLVVINEEGDSVKEIFHQQENESGALSNDLVGFWKSETIRIAVEFTILDALPGSLDDISSNVQIPKSNLERLLRALFEIGIVERVEDHWLLTRKGQLLSPKDQSFMASASLMWSKVQKEWGDLKEKLAASEIHYHPTFKEKETDKQALEIYRSALNGYAEEDFCDISLWPIWGDHLTLLGLGQTSSTVLMGILKAHPLLNGIVLNEDRPLYHLSLDADIKTRLKLVFGGVDRLLDFTVDAILLPRFLHYFPDTKACQILRSLYNTLCPQGRIYVFEMVLDPVHPMGGLLDLNMLAESGGRLRTLSNWRELFDKAGFLIERHQTIKPHLHLIIGKKS